jgi:hypothetical protein
LRRSTPGFAGAAARPAEVPKFRYRPLSEVRLREALLIREFRVVYMQPQRRSVVDNIEKRNDNEFVHGYVGKSF